MNYEQFLNVCLSERLFFYKTADEFLKREKEIPHGDKDVLLIIVDGKIFDNALEAVEYFEPECEIEIQ